MVGPAPVWRGRLVLVWRLALVWLGRLKAPFLGRLMAVLGRYCKSWYRPYTMQIEVGRLEGKSSEFSPPSTGQSHSNLYFSAFF